MNTEYSQGLTERYDFDAWRGRNTLDENLFIWQFFLSKNQFPTWSPPRIRMLAAPPTPATAPRVSDGAVAQENQPRLIQSVWKRASGATDLLLNVDTYECASRMAAHEVLLSLLGQFQSPLVLREREMAVGDVVFSHPGHAVVLFARANLVLAIRSAGSTTITVTDVVTQLDRELTDKPPTPVGPTAPAIQRLALTEIETQVGASVPVDLQVVQPPGESVMYKFFSRMGEVMTQEGQLVYEPTSAGKQDIELYAVATDRGVSHQAIRFDVQDRSE